MKNVENSNSYLEMGKNRCRQHAAKFKQLRRFKLNISPAGMAVRMKSIVGVRHPGRIKAAKHSNVLAVWIRNGTKN